MRQVWGVVFAVGLLVLVVFGTWACLSSTTDDPSTSQTTLIALVGLALVVVGLIGRSYVSRDHTGDASPVTAIRRAVGGLGLVVAVVAGSLTLLALVTDVSVVPNLLLVTVVALMAWGQGIAMQTGLSLRVSFAWLAVLFAFGAGVLVVVAAFAALTVGVLGLDPNLGAWIALVLGGATASGAVSFWALGRSDREAAPAAVRRVAMGRREPHDLALLKAGPRAILRRRPHTTDDPLPTDRPTPSEDETI